MSYKVKFNVWAKRIAVSSSIFLLSGLLSATSCGVFNSSNGFKEGFAGIMFVIFACFVLVSGVITAAFMEDYINHNGIDKND